jgi:hypothetical protein
MKQTILFDLEVRREGVLVPAKKDAGGDGLDIHRRCFQDPPVFGGIFDYFFMEHLVFAPAGDGVKLLEMIGERRHMEIAPDEVGGVAVLLAGLEVFADHELKKTDRIVGHWRILGDIEAYFKRRSSVASTAYGERCTAHTKNLSLYPVRLFAFRLFS